MNPRERFELLLSVERNEVTPEEAAARLGTTVERLQERLELVALTRVALTQSPAPVRPPMRARSLVAAAMVVAGLSYAQLTTFTADTPALAGEVNGNFSQLRTWLEQKVGTVGSANVAITGTSTFAGAAAFQNGASVDGGLRANSVVVIGALSAASLATGPLTAGTISGSSLSVSGNVSAGGNSWGSQASQATFNRSACGVETGAQCPDGQFVCGLFSNHTCGQDWPSINWRVVCCSL